MDRRVVPIVVVTGLAVAALGAAFVGLLLVKGCLYLPAAPPPPRPSSEAPVPEPPRVILTDLRRWDAATTDARRAAAEDVARRLPKGFALWRLETFSSGGQTHEVAIFGHSTTGLEFVLVPSGTFVMGSAESVAERYDGETQRAVTLSRPFLVGRTEVSEATWDRVMEPRTWPRRTEDGALPEAMDWPDATTFCDTTGLEVPTEAQWEWACRAGTRTRWSFGDTDSDLGEFAWSGANASQRPHSVGGKLPNAFGLFDLHGNVEEWTSDGATDGRPATAATDPIAAESTVHVTRGGSFLSPPRDTRSAAPGAHNVGLRVGYVGLRPVKIVPLD